MGDENFERQMRFILEQQARFAENLAKNDERWEKQKAELLQQQAEARARSRELDRKIDELVKSMSILRDALIGLTHHAERFDREMADLVARGKETDARLNALILIVERHISDHQ